MDVYVFIYKNIQSQNKFEIWTFVYMIDYLDIWKKT